MARIRVKDKRSNEPKRRNTLWQCLGLAHATAFRIDDAREAFYMVTNEDYVEKLLSMESKSIFQQHGFEIQNPPEYNAMRTITARYVDRHVSEHREVDIKENIEKENIWAKVEEVIKIPNNPHILKVRFETTHMAKKAIDNGILMLHQSIPPKYVEREIFINLTPCYRCYSYDHQIKECDKDETYKACSECSSKEHTYKDCKETTKKCLNCHLEHRTLAAKCQIRKDIIKKRTKEERDAKNIGLHSSHNNQQASFAQTLTSHKANNPLDIFSTLPKNAAAVILSAIAYGYYQEAQVKGSFQKSVDEMYTLNNIPKVKFPSNINPEKFLNTINNMNTETDLNDEVMNNNDENIDEEEVATLPTLPRGAHEKEKGEDEEESDSSDDDEKNAENQEKTRFRNQQRLQALNTGTYVKDQRILIPEIKLRAKEKSKDIIPKRHTHSDIVKLIKNRTIKYSYFHPHIEDDEVVRDMIEDQVIDLSAFKVMFIKDGVYNKLGNGTREVQQMITRKQTDESKDSWFQ